jgi:lysyl endopeptidase
MNKIFIFILISCLSAAQCIAQTTNEGQPMSWSQKTLATPIDYYLMPTFDLKKQTKVDALNDATGMKPWQFGYEHNVNYDLNNSGTWTTLSNGDRIWQIEFESKDALTMNLIFDDYELPAGATLYLYNPKTKEIQGAYTSKNNSADRMLGTTLVQGDDIVVEYYEPKAVQGTGALNISMVVHGYRSLGGYPREKAIKGLNDAGACNIDVACPLGLGWEDPINAVAIIIVGGSGSCTGALINNTSNDGTPYFLTANHCGTTGLGAWVFRFNWDSPVPVCAQTGASQDPGAPYNEVNGATLRANNGGSDVALMELNSAPTGNIYYAGWDRSTTATTEATGIHHPRGDVKKICREDDAVTAVVWSGAAVWEVANWDQGVTEPGSSGSPLFNKNQLIIGQLYGGGAACTGTDDNGLEDNYGRLDVSWNGASASERLSDWLDPGNTNVLTHLGYDPNGPGVALDAGVAQIGGIEELYCNVDSFIPEITIRNYGSDTITTVAINYDVDGVAFPTYTWMGNLAPNTLATVLLPTVTTTGGAHTFNATTILPNGSLDSNLVNDARSTSFFITLGGEAVDYALALDCYGSEVTWTISDSSTGLVLYSGGPYSDNFNTIDTLNDQLCLAAGCYRYAIYDDYGDGLDGTSGFCGRAGDYWMTDALGNELVRMTAVNGAFGDSAVHYFCLPFVINSQTSLPKYNAFKVFPNPTDGTVYIDVALEESEEVQLELYTVTGQLLQQINTQNTLSERFEFDLKAYSAGMYFVKLRIGDQTYAKKVIKD